MSILTVIQNTWNGKLRHTMIPLTKWNKSSTLFKINTQRARQYMGYNPKRKTQRTEIRPKISYAAEFPSP